MKIRHLDLQIWGQKVSLLNDYKPLFVFYGKFKNEISFTYMYCDYYYGILLEKQGCVNFKVICYQKKFDTCVIMKYRKNIV